MGEQAILALADGTIFKGKAFGAFKTAEQAVIGEVVFNTSMFGYQEILTDPSYAGQIICFTTPHIGNVGCNSEDNEGARVFVEGLIIRNESKLVSNYRASESLDFYLQKADKMGISAIDTRALVLHIRDRGAQMGALACAKDSQIEQLVAMAKAHGSMLGKDYVRHVSCKHAYDWKEGSWAHGGGFAQYSESELEHRPLLVAIDCGLKRNILRLLLDAGFRVRVVPAGISAQEILNLGAKALFVSNGPGDPATLEYVVNPVSQLLGKIPIFGICLGHQILAQALGGKTYKLKFGHRGGNHPVKNMLSSKVEITVQNHGFAVDAKTLPDHVKVTHLNLNDQTVEGLENQELKCFSVQYHPESAPGPNDARYLFEKFYKMVVN